MALAPLRFLRLDSVCPLGWNVGHARCELARWRGYVLVKTRLLLLLVQPGDRHEGGAHDLPTFAAAAEPAPPDLQNVPPDEEERGKDRH